MVNEDSEDSPEGCRQANRDQKAFGERKRSRSFRRRPRHIIRLVLAIKFRKPMKSPHSRPLYSKTVRPAPRLACRRTLRWQAGQCRSGCRNAAFCYRLAGGVLGSSARIAVRLRVRIESGCRQRASRADCRVSWLIRDSFAVSSPIVRTRMWAREAMIEQ